MAVTSTTKSVKLQVKYAGDVVNGKQTYVSKTYSKIKAAAADQDIYDVAKAIAGLQSKTLYSISKTHDSEIKEA